MKRFCKVIENSDGAQFLIEVQMIDNSNAYKVRHCMFVEEVQVEYSLGPMSEQDALKLLDNVIEEKFIELLDNPQSLVDALIDKPGGTDLKVEGPDNPQLN